MSKFTTIDIDRGFVHPNCRSFADLIVQVQADEGLKASRRRDLKSGLVRVAKALGRSPQAVPADPKWLRPRIDQVASANIGLTPKSWSNALSDVRAVLKHFGIVNSPNNHISDLSDEWRHLWRMLLAVEDPTLQPALCRFVYFLNRNGVAPEDVCERHAQAYLDALTQNSISKSPEVSYRAAVNGWNLAGRRLPEWPQQKISLPNRQKRIALPVEHFPSVFQQEFKAYLHSLEHPDPFSEQGRLAALEPSTIKMHHDFFLRFASILVHKGLDISSIIDMRTVVSPQNVERGLRWMLDKNEGKTSRNISQTAGLLQEIAQKHLQLPDDDVHALKKYAKRVLQKKPPGMTHKNRERLRAFDNPATVRAFLELPDRLFDQAKEFGDTYRAHLLREIGLAIIILIYCPVRLKNLTSINLEQNIQRPGDGRAFLVFTANDVKNKRQIEFELPSRVVKMIDLHLASRAPILCPHATQWLFPKRDGSRPIDPSQLANNVCKTIRKEIGVKFNIHLFRHLAAKLLLEARPGQYEVVRHLLGHAAMSTTLNFYTGFEAGTAARLFSDVIDDTRRP